VGDREPEPFRDVVTQTELCKSRVEPDQRHGRIQDIVQECFRHLIARAETHIEHQIVVLKRMWNILIHSLYGACSMEVAEKRRQMPAVTNGTTLKIRLSFDKDQDILHLLGRHDFRTEEQRPDQRRRHVLQPPHFLLLSSPHTRDPKENQRLTHTHLL
jgi:hypothetical protein